MDTSTLVKALKTAVRQVIKEELTEILREGLQSTITEIHQEQQKTKPIRNNSKTVQQSKNKVQFLDNKWASVLNETESLHEQEPVSINSFRDLMNENMEEIRMTSQDAINFGAMRQNMRDSITNTTPSPKIMEDPETGKMFEIPQEVQQAMTRDYSSLMKAINKKKGI